MGNRKVRELDAKSCQEPSIAESARGAPGANRKNGLISPVFKGRAMW